ncbi:glycoside hydrolase family 31 [Paludibacter propionicigenes WB4]|uniref:Glycoside hydrolase family 31 n=2 Tax=Paludibacter TaxID=346096 RepID=E4T6B6_PALPW|nr:glycoside hydrolase family 31 [Paludibacter propionicigenes WB4]
MRKHKVVLLFFVFLTMPIVVLAASFQKISDGIIVSLNQSSSTKARTIRLQVITDNIIRVTATPLTKIQETKSLITTYADTKKTGWSAKQSGNFVVLTTATTKAFVSIKTGEIRFTDLQGNIILQEQRGGGKSFKPIEVEGKSGFSFRQVFESPADEAFYGLGQHQSDEFNYKGKNEELFQYNTKVSIPFIVSNKNYGVLWDNYSMSRFGDPRPYTNLDQFKLYDKNGKEGGLTATYRQNKNLNQVSLERRESVIDYENIQTIKNFPKGINLANASVTWEGEIQPKESGVFRFILYYAGYTKVYLDDSLVVAERWRTAWNPNSYKFSAKLSANKKHKLRIDWLPDGGVSYMGLKALSPVPEAEQTRLSLWSEMGQQMDYYFIRGNNPDEVISGYRQVTGKASIMPKWAMGFWQSRERYKTQAEIVGTLKEFRNRQIPIDNIVLDWNYWPETEWGSHEFEKSRFPNPKGMVDSIHALDARIMISVWPKFYHNTEHFKEFESKGWMYMQAVKDSIRDWVGPGYVGSFYDAYSADARKLFWKQMKDHLYPLGLDAWWMDASEPNVRDCTDMPYRKALCGPTALGPSTEYFNAYALMNAEAIYDGQRGEDNNKRVFLLTRSGFSGLQRYSTATWSGDIATRWEDMKAQISAGINFSMSGVPYWTMDNGGFCVERRYEMAKEGSADRDEWRELNVRWHQFGAFVPLFRTHGQFPYRELWNIAPDTHPAYKTMLYYTQLRYRLMPYIYTMAGMGYFNDFTIMRALMMDFAADKNVLNIGDQYMFGKELMICPVYKYKARTRDVYFPKQTGWYNLYDGKYTAGGQKQTVDAPYDRMPIYVAAGSILPIGQQIQNTTQAQTDLKIYVYAGRNGTFTLYEDENVNYNYEKNAYSTIEFSYNDKDKVLNIAARKGSFKGMAKERNFQIFLVDQTKPLGIDQPSKEFKTIHYDGSKASISLK